MRVGGRGGWGEEAGERLGERERGKRGVARLSLCVCGGEEGWGGGGWVHVWDEVEEEGQSEIR